jgi:signal peptidase I
VPPPAPSPTTALLLSLLSPCVGHVYAGHARRGFAWVAAWLLAEVPLTWLLMRVSPFVAVAALVVVGLAIWIGAAVDALVVAGRASARAPWRLVAATLMALFAVERLETLVLQRWVVEAFVAPAASMSPSLLAGDHFLIDKTRSAREAPIAGDVVVLRGPEHPQDRFVYRVVATAGQRVEVKAGRIWLDGAPIPRCDVGPAALSDPTVSGAVAAASTLQGELFVERLGARAYLTLAAEAASASRDGRTQVPVYVRTEAGPWTVKAGEVFVLGDNRNNARDSREWFGGAGGGLPLGDVEGRVFAVTYSDTATALRFDRSGVDPSGRPRLPKELAALQPQLERCLAPDAPFEK